MKRLVFLYSAIPTVGLVSLFFLSVISRSKDSNTHLFSSQSSEINIFAPYMLRSNSTCQPLKHIFFLKTRKTGSTAIQNFLLRRAENRNLKVMLPQDDVLIGYPYDAKERDILLSEKLKPFDILTHHIRFNRTLIKEMISQENLFTFTILREPLSQMQSIFYYSGLHEELVNQKVPSSFSEFMDSVEDLVIIYKDLRDHDMRNPTLYDLGLNIGDMDNNFLIQETTSEALRLFDFVMIYEYFDESLILLKQFLCWDWDDVVLFKLNSQNFMYKYKLEKRTKDKFYSYNKGDVALYNIFLKKFKYLTKLYGIEKLRKDVKFLKKISQDVFNECVEHLLPASNITDVRFRPWNNGTFGLLLRKGQRTNERCIRYAITEDYYTTLLRNKYKEMSFRDS